jgi:hypothetical protein
MIMSSPTYRCSPRLCAFMLIATFVAPAGAFAAAFVTFQEGVNSYTGTQDTRIAGGGSATDPNANYGGLTSLTVFEREPNAVNPNFFRDLIRFDVSSLAPGTPVFSASLTLTYIQAVNLSTTTGFQTGGVTNSLYIVDPANVAWTESSATWNNAVQSAPQAWAGGPGLVAGSDYGAAVATAVSPNTGPTPNLPMTFVLNAAGIAAVQGWVNNPSSNTGFFMRQPAGTFSIDDFASSENATTSFHPLFTLSIPEPTSLGVFAVCGGAIIRRRRA